LVHKGVVVQMANKMEEKYFWQEDLDDDHILLGLSHEGQKEVGTVSFIDFYDDIQDVQVGDPLVSVEGSKAVTELEAPINGKVIKANLDLADNPEKINSHDHQDNWIVELAK
ncbi:MAG: glycine cleavage system protein H, partial [Bombilactobacillus mellis]|nr:glycine cleavage system protein H [Bombilactobacillus mellis]